MGNATLNAEDLRDSFRQAMRENPHDAGTRLIYADWLDENNRPEEAIHHRIIGLGIQREANKGVLLAHRRYAEAEAHDSSGTVEYSGLAWSHEPRINPLYIQRRKGEGITRRPATPLEASRAAIRAGAGLMTRRNMRSVNDARQAEDEAEFIAKNKPKYRHEQEILDTPMVDTIQRPKGEGSVMAAKAHERAAYHHLQAADDLETRGTGRRRMGLARLHRRAALAHLYAAYAHRNALGEV